MTDRISLCGMTFWGRHGALPGEKEKAQPFEVDLDLYLDLSAAGRSDKLEDTVDYAAVFEVARRTIEGAGRNLLEALAEDLAHRVVQECGAGRIRQVTLRIRKPEAPLSGVCRRVEVEITRRAGEVNIGADIR